MIWLVFFLQLICRRMQFKLPNFSPSTGLSLSNKSKLLTLDSMAFMVFSLCVWIFWTFVNMFLELSFKFDTISLRHGMAGYTFSICQDVLKVCWKCIEFLIFRHLSWLLSCCLSSQRHPLIKEVFFPGPGGCSSEALRPPSLRRCANVLSRPLWLASGSTTPKALVLDCRWNAGYRWWILILSISKYILINIFNYIIICIMFYNILYSMNFK